RRGEGAEAPHASDALPGDPLGLREALVEAAVLERQDVEAGRVGSRVQLAYLAEESRGVGELLQHERERWSAVLRLEDGVGDPPQLRERAVEADDVARQVHHQDPVRRGFERRVEQRERLAQVPLRPLAVGNVAVVYDDRADGRVVQPVYPDRLELARSRSAARLRSVMSRPTSTT